MKKFIFNEKESYTLSEVKTLLADNTKFSRIGYLEKTEDLTNTLNEHKTLKEAQENADFNKGLSDKLAKLGVSDIEKITKYGKFTKEMDEKALKLQIESMKSDFPESFKQKVELKADEFKTNTNELGGQTIKSTAAPRIFGGLVV